MARAPLPSLLRRVTDATRYAVLFLPLGLAQRLPAQEPAPATAVLPLIPLPQRVEAGAGAWAPPRNVPVTVSNRRDASLQALGALAVEIVREETGRAATLLQATTRRRGGIHLALRSPDGASALESYRLSATPAGVEITAPAPAGLFYGLQTLRQILQGSAGISASGRSPSGGRIAPAAASSRPVPAVTITDAPRFPYRGLHLDVGRHFQPVSFVKRYIDVMARYKFNTFHWHLTEDQGWRIEIPRYPRLTSVGACRAETMFEKNFDPYVGDGIRHCGFYTQEEIREVVAYARARYVTVIPEIEMPGHSKAALAAYPELACTPGPFEVRTTWGVDDDILCPSEQTFAFLEGVLTEVMALFPSRYIHIGGDEAPKTRWRASAVAQEVIRREGLKDEHELQSWFIRRIEQFLLRHDRRLIGWDEILEGGLAPQATVMSWRGISGGIDAAKQGHDVIMTPTSYLYFDYYQGDPAFEPMAIGGLVPLHQVYGYEPVPDTLTAEEARHVLGAQGNVWTEYLKTPAAIEYMAYPRALALAEVTWSPREARSWESFVARLPGALAALGRRGVEYRLPHVEGLEGDQLTLGERVRVTLRTLLPESEVRYTLDGSDPTPSSARYEGPLDLPLSFEGVRVTARAFTRDGKASAPRAATFTRTTLRDAEQVPETELQPGLRYAYYEATVRTAGAIDSLAAARDGVAMAVARRGDERAETYALRFSGFLRVPADGMYVFALESDDGSTLTIGDRLVVNNDGFHGPQEKTGMIALRAGLHPVTLRFFQGGGGAALALRVRVSDGPWASVPSEWLAHRR